jgi:hypothetical protein
MSNGEAFDEYDESEGIDESFEALDEADEAMDEADEASDEADEASDEASDEADEASDEAIDMSLAGRMRAAQDQARQQAWRARVASSLRADSKRATAAQQDISRQIRSINLGGRARNAAIGPLQGDGVVTATLANGRSAKMQFRPKLAPLGDVNRLRSVLAYNDRQQSAALTTQRRAIANLATAQAAAVKKLSEQALKSDKDLGERIVQSYNKLDSRISNELSGSKGIIEKNNRRIMRAMNEQRKRGLLNSLVIASSLPLYATFADKNKLITRDNVILTASLLGWLYSDEILDAVTGGGKSAKTWRGASNALSWLAPFGNIGTVLLTMNKRQHERFISGVSVITAATAGPTFTDTVTIPQNSLDDFSALQGNLPVTATIVTSSGVAAANRIVRAQVVPSRTPTISFTFEPPLVVSDSVTVAWILDTHLPA